MRTITSTLDTDRTIESAFTIRDQKQTWTNVTSTDPTGWSYDADIYSGGILRVAVVSGTLRFQYVADPTGSWGAWTDTGYAVSDNCKIGLYEGRVMYQNGTSYYYSDFNGSTFAAPVSMDTGKTATDVTCFMPRLSTHYFLLKMDEAAPSTTAQFGILRHVSVASPGSYIEWQGAIYGQQDTIISGDAVALGSDWYIFISAHNNMKPVMLKFDGTYFGELSYILPLDLMDDTSYMRLGLVNVINNSMWVTGALHRKNWVYPSNPMIVNMRSFGEHFSMEKGEFYIDKLDLNERQVSMGGENVDVYDNPGKTLLVGDYLYYCKLGKVKKKLATASAGKDPASEKFTLTSAFSAAMSFSGSSSLHLETLDPFTLSTLKPGDEVTVELGYDGVKDTIGIFDIDATPIEIGQSSEDKTIMATGRGTKRLTQWVSDAAYDYWSQTKEQANVSELGKLIRATGSYSGDLILDDLNIDGWLYSVGKSARNQHVTCRFDRNDGEDNAAGVFVGWYRETVEDAKERLGVDTVTEKDIGYHALVAKAGKEANNGYEGIGLWKYSPGASPVWVDGVYQSVPTDQAFDLKVNSYEGYITIHYKLASATNYGVVYAGRFTDTPHYRGDQVGRAGVFMRNVTAYSQGYPFDSSIMAIPVYDNSEFPDVGQLLVDDEKIDYAGKTANRDSTTPELTWAPGIDFIKNISTSSVSTKAFANSRSVRIVCQSMKPTKTLWANTVKIKVRKVGGASDGIMIRLMGSPRTSKEPTGVELARVFVPSSDIPDVITEISAQLSTPVEMQSGETYYLMVERRAGMFDTHMYYDGMPDYYEIQYNTINVYGNGSFQTFNEDKDTWTDTGGDMYFRIYASAFKDSNQIQVSGSIGERWTGEFLNMCLCSVEGKGEGLSFQIVDYQRNGTIHSFLVHKDPNHMFDTTSIFHLAPSLIVTARGADGTTASSHSGEFQVNEYVPPTLQATAFSYFSSDYDMRLTDCADAIAAKAGVSITHESDMSADHVGVSGWTYSTAVTDARGIVRLKCNGVEKGIAFDLDGSDNGKMITSDSTNIYYYTLAAGVPTLVERVTNAHTGWITYSFQGTSASAWQGNRLLASFTCGSNANAKAKVAVSGAGTVNVDWKELDMRIDNFVMEMGQNGLVIFNYIARETRSFLQDSQDGELQLFRNRTEVNLIGSPLDIVYDSTVMQSDAGISTRIRLIGVEEIELPTNDITRLGDLFTTINLERGDTANEMLENWPYIKEEMDLKYNPRQFSAAFLPELEPNDIIYVRVGHPTGVTTEKFYVQSVDVALRVSQDEAVLDMSVGGHV